MTQPDDTDRKAAEEFVRSKFGDLLPIEDFDVAGLAQFHADARAAGAAEMRERCLAECRSLHEDYNNIWRNSDGCIAGSVSISPRTWDQIAAAIRALK